MSGRSPILVWVALAVALSTHGAAQTVPLGYRIVAGDQRLDLTLQQDSPSAFHAVVVREPGSEQDEPRLRLAESLYPAPEAIARPSTCAADLSSDEPWWTGCDPRVPFALTASAVRFYLDQIAAFRRGQQPSRGRPLRSGAMRYEAIGSWESDVVIEDRSYRDVYVARLNLTWHVNCGELCGWAFSKQRIVVISRSGDVLAVVGDGRTPLAVS
jgi:hypothetical protein